MRVGVLAAVSMANTIAQEETEKPRVGELLQHRSFRVLSAKGLFRPHAAEILLVDPDKLVAGDDEQEARVLHPLHGCLEAEVRVRGVLRREQLLGPNVEDREARPEEDARAPLVQHDVPDAENGPERHAVEEPAREPRRRDALEGCADGAEVFRDLGAEPVCQRLEDSAVGEERVGPLVPEAP